MLGVESVGPSVTTTSTFPPSTAIPMATTAAGPAVVAGAGVGLLPLVAVATGDPDPRSLLLPVPAISGSNPVINNMGTATSTTNANNTSSNSNNNNNNSSNNNNNLNGNPAVLEQAEEFVKPIIQDGEIILEVECGQNKGAMYLSKLCQGSKGPCIDFKGSWLTPNEFQFVSGRETAKDWKRSIRHHGKSLKLLLAKGILTVHPTMCDCEGCRIGAVLTRKGEKRRIPNGERKRKSTGSAPENSGNGAFRDGGSGSGAVKNQDGLSDPKRAALDKSLEGGQSPLKESSLINLPITPKDGHVVRLPENHVADVNKMAMDNRLAPHPLMPLLAPDRTCDLNTGTPVVAAAPSLVSKDSKDSSTSPKQTHGGSSSNGRQSPVGVISSPDVKVLSSGGNAVSERDKSLSRLALYQAVSASVKGGAAVNERPAAPRSVSLPKCDIPVSKDEKRVSGNIVRNVKKTDSCSSPKKDVKEGFSVNDVKTQDNVAVENGAIQPLDLQTQDVKSDTVVSHSIAPQVEPCDLNSSSSSCNSSISVSPPTAATSVLTAASPVAPPAPAAPAALPSPAEFSPQNAHKEEHHKNSPSSLAAAPAVAALPPPGSQSKHLEKEEHVTIRHPSPERSPNDPAAVTKPSPAKVPKEHSPEKPKDRKHESSSSSSSDQKDRHVHKDVSSSRQSHEREVDKRRPEERSEKDRKPASTPAQSSKEEPSYARGPDFQAMASGRSEGLPTSVPVSLPAAMTDPAAFSEYMRVLAAGHNGLVPPPTGCLPPMFPLRSPSDVPINAGLLHPMHPAAAGMFSTPGALFPKDAVMYPPTSTALPAASYSYGTPGLTPVPLLPPHYPAAAATSMLDYSRPFPYLPWSGGLPLMMPDAMTAAAAAAAASASAKRSREEMESAVDMSGKRVPLPMAAYGAGSVTPLDYMAAYRGLPTPLTCGMESSMYDKNAELLRKRMYPDLAASAAGGSKGVDSPYLNSLPDYYRALYCCRCMENRPGDIRTWSVDEVVKLVSSLEGCSVYTEIFREQRVDGKILVLLTTDHLMKNLGMKLGPAMTLTSRVAKMLLESTRTSGCDTCRRLASMVPAVQSAAGY